MFENNFITNLKRRESHRGGGTRNLPPYAGGAPVLLVLLLQVLLQRLADADFGLLVYLRESHSACAGLADGAAGVA